MSKNNDATGKPENNKYVPVFIIALRLLMISECKYMTIFRNIQK